MGSICGEMPFCQPAWGYLSADGRKVARPFLPTKAGEQSRPATGSRGLAAAEVGAFQPVLFEAANQGGQLIH
jgi:hypothetical protein